MNGARVTARELLAWGDLDERRRRKARRGPGALSPWVFSVAGGLLLAAEVSRRLGALGAGAGSLESASHLWIAVCALLHVIVFFAAPFRAFWRFDSPLLARLPLDGQSLFQLSLFRALRASARVSLPCALGAVPFALLGAPQDALRHVAVLGIAFLGAGLLAPSVALAAGAAVASDKAKAVMESFGAEFQAPRTTWLGALPGLGAAALTVALLAAAPWTAGARPPGGEPLFFLLPGIGLPLLAAVAALARAGVVMGAALREVSALDQERLAHVERSTPSLLERLWFRLLGPGARLLAEKDAALSRRRYPSPYFLFPLGILTLWIFAAARPESLLLWGAALLAAFGAYSALMARRLFAPPIEEPRLLASLPLSPREVRAAKFHHPLLRVLLLFLLAGTPLVLRAAESLLAAALTAGLAFATAVAVRLADRWA